MSNKRDYYEILGVGKNATDTELKKSYRKLSKQHHPDKMAGKSESEIKESEEKFKEINEAYSVLSDPEKRGLYDQFGHDMGRGQQMDGGFGDYDVDLEDMINRMQQQAGFGGFGGRQQRPQGPQPLTVEVGLTLEEIFEGVKKTFKYKVNRKCKHCNGKKYVESEGGRIDTCKKCNGAGMIREQRGHMMFMSTCPQCGGNGHTLVNPCKTCNGTGFEKEDKTIEIDFPKGIMNGQYLHFSEGGHEQNVNGTNHVGDLIVVAREIQNQTFQREGNNLHCVIEPSIYDSILGEEVSVKSIDGKTHKFKLKVGTENGEAFRLNGLGMPMINTNKYGDLIVHIKNKMPKTLTNEEIKLLKKLKDGK